MSTISKSKTWVDNEVLNATDLNQGFDDIINVVNGSLNNDNIADAGIAYAKLAADVRTSIIGVIYPVGSLYISTVSTNPATILGVGTWTAFGAGRVLVGINAADTDFDTAEETGGAKTVSHTHTGTTAVPSASVNVPSGSYYGVGTNIHTHTITTDASSPSVVQPYIVVYMWKRTA